MVVADIHPSVAELTAFTLGTLDDAALSAVESHLAECPSCQERAAESSGDNLVDVLRRIHAQTRHADTVAQTHTPGPAPADAGGTQAFAAVPEELARHERYRIVRLLGEGGMGSVYEAEHRVMQRAVAVKVIKSAFTSRPLAVQRFRREVHAAARLAHPNVVTTYDAEDAGATLFLVMEYVEGVSLARLVKERGPLPVAEACHYIRQAALGLQHAHERGMIHRDIKPENLIRSGDGTVKVLDFGLAALTVQGDAHLTESNVVMGTPDYMAPEQAADPSAADIRADVYSLGCSLYYLLTGRSPYSGTTSVQKILAHREQPLPSIRRTHPDVPAELARVLARMLAKKPADRYQTPGEVAVALQQLTPTAAAPPGRRRAIGTALAAALCIGIALAGVVYRIQTDTGELVITTGTDDVEVVVKQGGKLIRIIDTKMDRHITLRSGSYELELNGVPEGLKLSIDKATLTRGETVLAKIERLTKPAPPTEPGSPRDAVRLIHRIDWRTDGILYGDCAPAGRYFLGIVAHQTGHPRGVRVWEGETGKFLWDNNNAGWGWFSPGGDLVYLQFQEVLHGPIIVRAYRTATGEFVREVCRSPKWVAQHAHSADGQYIAQWHPDKTLSLWSVADGKRLREWQGNPHWQGEFSSDSRHIELVLEPDNRRRRYRLPGLEEVPLAEALTAFSQIDWQPTGTLAIAGELNAPPESWWLIEADGRKVRRWLPRSYAKVLAWAHWINGQESLVSLDDGTVRLFDATAQQERSAFRLPPGETARGLYLSPDRTCATAVTTRGAVLLFRLPGPRANGNP